MSLKNIVTDLEKLKALPIFLDLKDIFIIEIDRKKCNIPNLSLTYLYPVEGIPFQTVQGYISSAFNFADILEGEIDKPTYNYMSCAHQTYYLIHRYYHNLWSISINLKLTKMNSPLSITLYLTAVDVHESS